MKALLVVLGLLSCTASAQIHRSWPVDILRDQLQYGADTPHAVPLEGIVQGCARLDCIPALNHPAYLPVADSSILRGRDWVLGLEIGSQAWAYPLRILRRHEVVNDVLAGMPVLVTYCPLCGSGMAFDRRVRGKTLHFKVSGLLHDNDLLMIDLETATLWQQMTGEAIVGPMTGARLQPLPLGMSAWKDWKSAHPEGKVLSHRTGYPFSYRDNPYQQYSRDSRLLHPVRRQDARLRRKQRIWGLKVGKQAIALEMRALQRYLKRHPALFLLDGRLRVYQAADGSIQAGLERQPLVLVNSYWFAWYSFHPDTWLWEGQLDTGNKDKYE